MNFIWAIIKILLKLIPEFSRIQDEQNKQLVTEIARLEKENIALLKARDHLQKEAGQISQNIVETRHKLASLDQEEDLLNSQIAIKNRDLEKKIDELKKLEDKDIFDEPYTLDRPDSLN